MSYTLGFSTFNWNSCKQMFQKPESSRHFVNSNAVSWRVELASHCHPASPLSYCQVSRELGTGSEREWWLMTRLLRRTLPRWRTAAFSALIGQACTLASRFYVESSSERTTHSENCLGLTVLIKYWPQGPLHVIGVLVNSTCRVVHICQRLSRVFCVQGHWQKIRIFGGRK